VVNELISSQEIESLGERCDFSAYEGARVLITGGAGMIGSWLTTALLKAPKPNNVPYVTVLSRRSTPRNLYQVWDLPKFEYVQGSVESTSLQNFDYIFHAASAASPTKYDDVSQLLSANIHGAQSLIRLSPKLKNFVYLSSGEVYGTKPPFQMKEDYLGTYADDLTRNAYPKAKLNTEDFINKESQRIGFKSTVIRLFHTFGPGLSIDDGRSFADFVWAIARGKSPVLHSPGNQVRAFLYLEDSIAGIFNASEQANSTIVNVGSDRPLSIRAFAELACQVSGMKLSPEFNFDQKNFEHSPIGASVPSNELLRQFGWNQKYSTEDALIRTINWAKSEGAHIA